METNEPTPTVRKQGAEDSGRYFRYMAEFVGFTETDAQLIRQTKPIIEKHLPAIVTKFYEHLLRYPPTRKFFLKNDGTLDQEYVELRMRHQTNFWLRTADAIFDDDYARYVDYVGRAHTSRGADPHIYIAERYVIGMVGMVQHAISEAVSSELKTTQPDLRFAAGEAWDKLMMLILELLSRAYGEERQPMTFDPLETVDIKQISRLAEEAFEHESGLEAKLPTKSVAIAMASEIPDGERKIVQVEGLTIGVFHHRGGWYALRSSCVHRGGPVATGNLTGDVLTCPWHGFQYNVTDGRCLADPNARLDMYEVSIEDGAIHLHIPDLSASLGVQPAEQSAPAAAAPVAAALAPDQFRTAEIAPGRMRKVQVNGQDVAVFNVAGVFYATQNVCTHAGGSLSEGDLDGACVTCPIHGSQFDVTTGQVIEGPADEPLKLYKVTVDGALGRVEAKA